MLFIFLGVISLFGILFYIRLWQSLSAGGAMIFSIGSLIGAVTCFVMNKFILPKFEGSIIETQKIFNAFSFLFEKMMDVYIGFAVLFFIMAAVKFFEAKHSGNQEV